METKIYRGRGDGIDREDYLDFINYVFGFNGSDDDFQKLLPKLYKPEYSPCENSYVVTEDGKLRAAVGVFVREQSVCGEWLSVHGVGNVAVHPYARSRGYMRELMHMAVDDMIASGADYSDLGGRRQRYGYFSYESAEPVWEFTIDQTNARHCFRDMPLREIAFREVTDPDDPALDRMVALHEKQPLYMKRDRAAFLDICRSWGRKLYEITDGSYGFAGYRIGEMDELLLADESDFYAVVRAYLADHRDMRLAVPLYNTDRIAAASLICEHSSLHDGAKCTVFHFEKVVRAFLNLKAQSLPNTMCDGALTVLVHGIAGDERFTITLRDGVPTVEKSDKTPDMVLEHKEAVAFFFGVMSPERMKNACAAAWFPLPMHEDSADHV